MKKIIATIIAGTTILIPTLAFANLADYYSLVLGAGGGIDTMEQWKATTTPDAAITQRVFGKPVKISGLLDGCLSLNSGIATTSGVACGSGSGSGGGVGTSTNPFMATYFVATSTSKASTFPYASTTALSASAICISTDCRTSWPSASGGGVGWASTTGDTNSIFMYGSGKVGIGSSTPFYKLSVEGSSSLGNQAIAGYFTATSTTATSVFGGSVNVGSELSLNGPNYKGRLYQDGSETFFMSANYNPATDQGDYGSYSGWMIDMNAPGDELTIRRAGAGYADSSEFVDLVDLTGAGNFGIGTVPSARLHAISTTEQCRFGYDSSNYWNCTTDSNGKTTFDSVGTTPKFAFSDKLTISDGTAANPSIGFTSDDDGSGTGFYRSAANRIGASVNGTFVGQFLSTGFEADSAMSFTFNNRGGFSAPADGQIRIAANGGANLSRFILGSNTSTGYGLCFGSNSTMALCDGAGNATSTRFGVGSTTPWGQLSASSTSAYPTLAIEQKSTGPAAVFLGGNVGIGTSSPFASRLSIKSGGTSTTRNTVISDSNDRVLFQILDNGNVKIGSSTATTGLLDVDGVISSGADGNIGGGEIRSYQTPGFYIGMKTDTSVNKSGLYRSNAGGDKYFSWYNTGSGDTGIATVGGAGTNIILFDNANEAMRIRNSMVSIGAAKFPAHTLDITQPAMSTAKTASYDAIKATNTATSSTASVRMSGIETVVTGVNNGTGASNVGVYVSSVSGGTANYDAIFNGTGVVGIGTTTPPVSLSVNGLVQTKGYTVATLPTCTTVIRGSMGYVTDALAPTFLATVAGGGAIVAPVFCDGTNWVTH